MTIATASRAPCRSVASRSVASRAVVSRLRVAMGTFVAVEAEAPSQAIASCGVDAAFRAVARVESLMHPSRSGSDLSAIHGAPPGTAVSVDPWTWEVLMLSKRLNRASQGIFDPCVPDAAGRILDLECVAANWVIAHAPLRIDLGGIAKGYAVDRALLAMRSAGCDGGLVNAGGDLGVYGRRSHRIVCRDQKHGRIVVQLRNGSLAGSAARSAAPPAEHRGYYHGVDRSTVHSGTIAVRAGSAVIADALTTCVLASGGDTDPGLLSAFGARLIAWDGDLHP